MKSLLLFPLSFMFIFHLEAQNSWVNVGLSDVIETSCPFDDDRTVWIPRDAVIFQTLDNTPFGPIDSTICPTMINNMLDLSSIAEKNLYIEIFTPQIASFDLKGNDELSIYAFIWSRNITPFDKKNVYLEVEHETIFADGSNTSVYPSKADGSGTIHCMLIENFEQVSMKRVVIEIEIESINAGAQISLNEIYIEKSIFQMEIATMAFKESHRTDEGFRAGLEEIVNGGTNSWNLYSYFITHPSIQEARAGVIHYFDVEAPDSDKPGILDIVIEEFQSGLFIQPYVTVRSDFIRPDSDLRHTLRFVQENDLCLPTFIDFVIDNSIWYYKSGHIQFEHGTSCMLFTNKAMLFVDENTTFEYGQEGTGMLGIRGGSFIELGKNAAMHIGNTLALIEDAQDKEVPFIKLERGQKLSFGPHAQVVDMNSELGDLKMDIYMNGGILEWEALDERSKGHLNLIYPEKNPKTLENIKVYSDYTNGNYVISTLMEKNINASLEVLSVQGQSIFNKKWETDLGWIDHEIDLSGHPAGLYLYRISSTDLQHTGKLFKP